MTQIISEINHSRFFSSMTIGILEKIGIEQVFSSPGLRNAPLIAACQANSNISLVSGIDERTQAAQALGYAKASSKTPLLICTSGTALAHYFPAIIEAFKSQIPLFIISADRPVEQSLFDDNQCIDQNNIYGKFVKQFYNLGAPNNHLEASHLIQTLKHLYYKANSHAKGPVHLNFPLREPVDLTLNPIDVTYLQKSKQQYKHFIQSNFIQTANVNHGDNNLDTLYSQLEQFKKPLFVFGELPQLNLDQRSKQFITGTSVQKLFDVTSGLKYNCGLSSGAIPSFDHPEVKDYFTQSPPDGIIHVGGRCTSKFYYEFLKQHYSIPLITINDKEAIHDPAARSSAHHNIKYTELIKALAQKYPSSLNNHNVLRQYNDSFMQKAQIINAGVMSFPQLSKFLVESLPNHSHLYIGNSTIIRSFDAYVTQSINKDYSLYFHRGASGIEGFIASFTGLLRHLKQIKSVDIAYLIIGDISFLHDIASLLPLTKSGLPFNIIIANNNCGGIFNLLPIKEDKGITEDITTPHDYKFGQLAPFLDIDYQSVENITELKAALELKHHQLIIDVKIDDLKNQQLYSQLKTIK